MSTGTSGQSKTDNINPGISVVQVAIPPQSILHNSSATIHPNAALQTIQVTAVDSNEIIDSKKRREILARRPSYRKILNDLATDGPTMPSVSKIEEESNSSHSHDGEESTLNSVQFTHAPVVPQTIQITAHPDGSTTGTGLQTLTMTNATSSSPPGATIVQYTQGPDGQFYIPVGNGGMQAYQLTSASGLGPGVVVAQAGSGMSSPIHGTEEVSRKRELRLLKNREAARECRRKKKEYVKCLENRVAVLENQNKTLIEELKALKELYCQKEG